jgi:hypothetical protein
VVGVAGVPPRPRKGPGRDAIAPRRPRGIEACQRCGSWDLRIPGVADGSLVGLAQDLSRRACLRCGLVAVPIEFDSEEARAAYEAEQARHPSADWPQSGWPSLRLPGRRDRPKEGGEPGDGDGR